MSFLSKTKSKATFLSFRTSGQKLGLSVSTFGYRLVGYEGDRSVGGLRFEFRIAPSGGSKQQIKSAEIGVVAVQSDKVTGF